MPRQLRSLRLKPHVIIATPGRLIDHLEQRTVTLSNVGILVLDEADRMLDMGFEPQIKRILSAVPQDRQTMLFSATMPPEIGKIAMKYMKQPLRIEVAPSGTAAEKVEQEVFMVHRDLKILLLEKLLAEYKGTVLVFSRTKHGAKKIARIVNHLGHRAAELHSNRSLSQRIEAMNGFRSGKYRVLIATDIAARGIDVTGIELVLNYDLPENTDDYVHRIGRTGRAGLAGKAISFACPEQKRDIQDIERLIRARLPISPLPDLPKSAYHEPRVISTSQFERRGEGRFQGNQRRRPFHRGRRKW
jgi:ATP-dependent RNA helicase RhlE